MSIEEKNWLKMVRSEIDLKTKLKKENEFYHKINDLKFFGLVPLFTFVLYPSIYSFIFGLLFTAGFIFVLMKIKNKDKTTFLSKQTNEIILFIFIYDISQYMSEVKSSLEKEIEEEKAKIYKSLTRKDLETVLLHCKSESTKENLAAFRKLKFYHNRYSEEIEQENIQEQLLAEEALLEKTVETITTE
ncbi:MAG: hypothetical protein CL760_01885 [Chloroflexi bacterium]|nr:hypothetical protein [Chloroflexota bacterium]|tara:strand:- start:5084 stop:5647 length:564 start_codon:yes stop_codon:yes gene_type:complete